MVVYVSFSLFYSSKIALFSWKHSTDAATKALPGCVVRVPIITVPISLRKQRLSPDPQDSSGSEHPATIRNPPKLSAPGGE